MVALSRLLHMCPGVPGLPRAAPGENWIGGSLRPPGVKIGGVRPGSLSVSKLRKFRIRRLCLLLVPLATPEVAETGAAESFTTEAAASAALAVLDSGSTAVVDDLSPPDVNSCSLLV